MHIKKPLLLIDKVKTESNITRMNHKAQLSSAIFRPHFKTHQSPEVGQLFKNHGINKITVSSVTMAEFFARNGWDDITIAFPVNLLELKEINNLADKINLNLLVESKEVAKKLAAKVTSDLGVFIKIDTGYHRTGLSSNAFDEIDQILYFLDSKHHKFKGFLVHAGNTYHAKGKNEINSIKVSAARQLIKLKNKYQFHYPDIIISYGDTPSCSQANDCSEFDEIRPGNFVYYDVMQYHLGSCTLDEISVALACPVVAVHTNRNELVVYGGGVHLSKEFIAGDNNFQLYGYVVRIDENGKWRKPISGAYVSSLSQEHGVIKLPNKELQQFKVGDVLAILPVHSCLTANLMRKQSRLI